MKQTSTLCVTETAARCPIGEAVGQRNAREGAIPVLSCEGACIRGEIARLAAHRVAKAPGYRRGCHGELFAVPDSAMAGWVRNAEQVVVIDGCPLKCHSRIVEHLVPRGRLRSFNALAQYRKFSDVFDIDAVPEAEREDVAAGVARWVLDGLRKDPAESAGSNVAPTCSRSAVIDSGSPPAAGESCASRSNPTDATTQFTDQTAALVGIGAAVAANCEPCLEHHARNAEKHGVSREDMGRAVALAKSVKDAPHRKILAAAERLTQPQPEKAENGNAARCCDGSSRNAAG